MTVNYKARKHRHVLQGTPKRLTKSLVRGERDRVLNRLLQSENLVLKAAEKIGVEIKKEIKLLCSNKLSSIIRENSKTALEFFSWETIVLELQKTAPLLVIILKHCLSTVPTEKLNHILCVCACILVRSRNSKMNMLQSVISILLYAGHAGKMVSSILFLHVLLYIFFTSFT